MQPVLQDLNELQNKWNNPPFIQIYQSKETIEKNVHLKQRPAYLRALHVSVLVLSAISLSTAICFTLSAFITVMKGDGLLLPFFKLVIASSFGVIAYDSIRLSSITDRCRVIFRESLRHIEANTVTDALKAKWNRVAHTVNRDYKELLIVDTALDALYPFLVNY